MAVIVWRFTQISRQNGEKLFRESQITEKTLTGVMKIKVIAYLLITDVCRFTNPKKMTKNAST